MTTEQLQAENATLRRICEDFQLFAKRYAEGRMSTACQTVNMHTQTMLDMGVPVNPGVEKIIWALDGGGRRYDRLTEAQCTPGTPEARGNAR